MDHCKDSENVIMHSILCVKLEPFEEDEDCTQNIDPLQADSNVCIKVELLQDLKTEIESDGNDQTMNELIQEDASGDTGTKIEEINIKTEYIEASTMDTELDSRRIIEDYTSVPNQLSEKTSSTNTIEKNTTRYELSHSCEPQRSDVINETPTNDGSLLNVTSVANHTRARSDTCSSVVDVLKTQNKHSTSEKEESKQSSSLIAHSLPHPSYVCDVCAKTFKNPRNLGKHKVVHTHQKLHVCDICKKAFSRSSPLIRHIRTHTGQKPYGCDICKKRFSDSSDLVKHKRTHTGQKPYICDICKKGFSRSSDLVKHKRIHTGEKPFVCEICKKGFSLLFNLVKHKRIHTGEKPFVCDICKKGFTDSSNLVAHKRTHHGQKSCV